MGNVLGKMLGMTAIGGNNFIIVLLFIHALLFSGIFYFSVFMSVVIGISMTYRLMYHILWAVYGIGFAITAVIVLLIAVGYLVRMIPNSKEMTAEIAM